MKFHLNCCAARNVSICVLLLVGRSRVIRVGLIGSCSVWIMLSDYFFIVFLFVLHGAKHFCEKFGDSWPEAGREQFDKMCCQKLPCHDGFAVKCRY